MVHWLKARKKVPIKHIIMFSSKNQHNNYINTQVTKLNKGQRFLDPSLWSIVSCFDPMNLKLFAGVICIQFRRINMKT